jgi:hypothetical protein
MPSPSRPDTRFALRALALGLLALALGAHTAGFSWAEHALLSHLPVRDPGRAEITDWGAGEGSWGLEAVISGVARRGPGAVGCGIRN